MSILIRVYKALSHISEFSKNTLWGAYVWLKDGETEIQKDWIVAKVIYLVSRGAKGGKSPWVTWPPEMSWMDPYHKSSPGWGHSGGIHFFLMSKRDWEQEKAEEGILLHSF